LGLSLKVTINLDEEISSQHSILAVAWVFLETFSQIYYENWEQKAKQRDSLNCSLSSQEAQPRRVWLLKRLVPLKEVK
jgi:hypothetical protein